MELLPEGPVWALEGARQSVLALLWLCLLAAREPRLVRQRVQVRYLVERWQVPVEALRQAEAAQLPSGQLAAEPVPPEARIP